MSIDEIMMNRIWKQRDDLLKENKRLEDAGDELMYDNDDIANINRWNKAKEAKL